VIDIVAGPQESIGIPLAVKLSPFYTSLPNLAAHLDRLGVAGLVLFNRFYQPDIDPDRREVSLRLNLSDSSELALRLRWIAILSGRVKASLVLTGGVHEPLDAVKAVMAGADGVQIVSALLKHGPRYLTHIRTEFERWGDEHGYASIGAMRGCLNLARCPNPESLDRGTSSTVEPRSPQLCWREKCIAVVLKQIVVATDTGEAAQVALNYGRELARTFSTSLRPACLDNDRAGSAWAASPSTTRRCGDVEARRDARRCSTEEDRTMLHPPVLVTSSTPATPSPMRAAVDADLS
jgi:hypothetical protein